MPSVPGKLSIDTATYIRTRFRDIAILLHWEPTAAIADAPAMQAFVDAFQQLITPKLAPLYSEDVKIPLTIARYYSDTLNLDAASNASFSDAGTADAGGTPIWSTTLPDAVALIVQRRTATPGRAGRGRIFVPSLWEGFNDDGAIQFGLEGPAEDFAAFMGADQTVGGMTIHARHYSKSLQDLIVITQCRAMRDFRQQRRREAGKPNLPM